MTETGDRTAHPEVSGTGGAGDTDDLCSRTATELLQDYRSGSLSPVEVTDAEVRDADVVVLVTDHDAFPYEMIGSEAKLIFDTRSRMEGPNVNRL